MLKRRENKLKKKGLTLRQREMINGYIFILPWLIGVVFFFLLNIIHAGRYSFNELTIDHIEGGYTLTNVGLSNFRFIFFEHGTFVRQVVTSLTDMLINVPLIIFFSLFIAIILNRAFFGRGFVRAIFFLPVIMATPAIDAAIASIFDSIQGGISSMPDTGQTAGFHPGIVALMLGDFGMPLQFITYILDALARLYDVIRASGVQILIFLAALQAIPGSVYEVAKIEGATAYETFWKITLPMVSPLVLTNVVYTVVDTFADSIVVETAITTAFSQQRFGVSSAMSIISSSAASIALLIVGYLISKKVFYQTGE